MKETQWVLPISPEDVTFSLYYTVSQKNKTPNSCPYLHQILTDHKGDMPALTPAEAGTRFSDPGRCKAELT